LVQVGGDGPDQSWNLRAHDDQGVKGEDIGEIHQRVFPLGKGEGVDQQRRGDRDPQQRHGRPRKQQLKQAIFPSAHPHPSSAEL